MSPQPPKSDPIWNGNTTGSIWYQPCYNNSFMPTMWRPVNLGPGAPAAPVVTPQQLAQQALNSLTLAKPVLQTSPGTGAAAQTYVGVYTWYWTNPATYKPLHATAAVPGLSVTVTAAPSSLEFVPGDGSAAVTCRGAGRPWTAADGSGAPTGGGCAFTYTKTSSGVTATMRIHWTVSWKASTGPAGDLAAMQTQATRAIRIEQIQTVNR